MSDMIGCHCSNAVWTDGYMSKGVGYLEYSAIGPVRYIILQVINTVECAARGIWASSEVIVLKARMFRGMSVNVSSGDFSATPDSVFKSFLSGMRVKDYHDTYIYISCDRITQASSTGRAHLHNPAL